MIGPTSLGTVSYSCWHGAAVWQDFRQVTEVTQQPDRVTATQTDRVASTILRRLVMVEGSRSEKADDLGRLVKARQANCI